MFVGIFFCRFLKNNLNLLNNKFETKINYELNSICLILLFMINEKLTRGFITEIC